MGVKSIATKYGRRWLVRWTDELGHDCKKRMPAGATKEQALEFLRDQQVRVSRIKAGLEVRERNPRNLLVKDVARRWMKSQSAKTQNTATNHIVELPIGEMRLDKVTPAIVKRHLDDLTPRPPTEGKTTRETPLSAKTRNIVRGYLHQIFEAARDAGELVGDNPVAKVKPKKAHKKNLVTYTPEECARLVRAVQQPWRGILAIALHGLRKGESWGLDVADVDLKRNEIHVLRSHDKPYPKSGRARVVPIIPSLRFAVAEAVQLAKGRSVPLFPGRDPDHKKGTLKTKRRHADGSVHKAYHRAIRLAELPRIIRFHDLRHTIATLLLQAGVPIAHVSKMLGHSGIAITNDFYGHLVTDDLHAAVRQLKLPAPRKRAAGG